MRPDIHRERTGGLCRTGEVGNQFESLLQSALRQPPSDPPPQFGIGYINLFVIKASIFEKPAIQTVTLRRQDVLFHHGAAQPQPKKSHREDTKNRKGFLPVFVSSR